MWCMPGKKATVPEPQMGADDRMGCTPAAMPRDHRAVVRSRQRPWRIGSALFAVAVTVISIAFIAADLQGRENGPSAGNVGSASNKSNPVAGGVGSASKTSTHTTGWATTGPHSAHQLRLRLAPTSRSFARSHRVNSGDSGSYPRAAARSRITGPSMWAEPRSQPRPSTHPRGNRGSEFYAYRTYQFHRRLPCAR